MSLSEAQSHYDKQAGDPPRGYIDPADAQQAIGVIYRDMEAGDARTAQEAQGAKSDAATADQKAAAAQTTADQAKSDAATADQKAVTAQAAAAAAQTTANQAKSDAATADQKAAAAQTTADQAKAAAAAVLPDRAGADEGDVLQLFGPSKTPTWSDNLATALNRIAANEARLNNLESKPAVAGGNMLTLNQATATSALSTTAGFKARGSTLTSEVVAGSRHGRVLRQTVNAATPRVQLGTVGGFSGQDATQGNHAVIPGQTVTVKARMQSAKALNCYLTVYWFQADGTTRSSTPSSVGETQLLTAGVESERVMVTTAPADAQWATVVGHFGGAAGDVCDWTQFGFWAGAGGQWAPPGSQIVGLSAIRANGAFDLSGNGSPEGRVQAPPSSTWVQLDDATSGWSVWSKKTGWGATGWTKNP